MTTRNRKRIREAATALGQGQFMAKASIARLTEVGRVLSAANEDKLRTALDALQSVLSALEKPDDTATEAGGSKCATCEGDGKIKAGTTKCPDCGGSGLAADVNKEARRTRLVALAEAYSAAASDAGTGAYIAAALLDLMSEESDEPAELAMLSGAFMLLQQWIAAEVSTIGSPDDVEDSASAMSLSWWESARTRVREQGGIHRLSAAATEPMPAPPPQPSSGGYVPEPYTADADETVQCPMCGCMNSPDAKFCDQCGVALTGFHPSIGEGGRRVVGDLVPLLERAVREDGSTSIKLIQPGWGSTGYYSNEVLEAGASVFPAGTKMFWDHPTMSEEWERPERSLRDLAAETTSDAVWDANGAAGPGLYANAKVFSPYREALEEIAPSIGVSIVAYGKAESGTAEGKSGQIITELVAADSVDFVTYPGAGGQVLSLFESARQRSLKTQEVAVEVEKDPKFIALREQASRDREQLVLRDAKDVIALKLSESTLPEITRKRLESALAANAPMTAEGQLDKPALEKRIEESVASETEYLANLSGAGKITGMGVSDPSTADHTADLEKVFEGLGHAPAAAKIAAAGRK